MYLDCETNANPPAQNVRFFKDGQPLQSEPGRLFANQTLVLQGARRTSRGLYHCEASNALGHASSNNVFLRIQCKFFCVFLNWNSIIH